MVSASMLSTTLSPSERTQLERAEHLIQQGIKTFITIGQHLIEIRENKLYREDYQTFDDYMLQRWGIKRTTGYDYMAGYQLASNLEQASAPVDTTAIKPSFTRLLSKFPAETQVQLYTRAEALARAEDTAVTSRHINQAITDHENNIIRQQVIAYQYSPVIVWMDNQEITPAKALDICDTLTTLKPAVRGQMLYHQVKDTALMRLMNDKRHTETYKETVASGTLSVWYDDTKCFHELPLTQCTRKHFADALNFAHMEHLHQAAEANNARQGIQQISILVHLGDGSETIKSLINAGASTTDLQNLHHALSQFLSKEGTS